MGQLRAYFDRIQGRLLAAFIMALLGTVAIFVIGYRSLEDFSSAVTTRNDLLARSTDVAMRLEGAILDQIATGERLLISRSANTSSQFDSLHNEVNDLWQQYNASPQLDQGGRDQLNRVRELHTRIETGYRAAHQDYVAGRTEAALTRL